MKFKLFDDTIFTNGTTAVDLSPAQCGVEVMKHDCIYCCIVTDNCNIAYIAYKYGSNQVDWCQLYKLGEIELISAKNQSTVPEYWVQKWIQNGGQPAKSQLAVFGKHGKDFKQGIAHSYFLSCKTYYTPRL